MGFLRNKNVSSDPTETPEMAPEQTESVLNKKQDEQQSENLAFVNLMSRFFRNQKFFEGPETLHENEAWAPETEFVGLFRKRRVNAEEQPSSLSSGSQ